MVSLRDVQESDLPLFFEHQREPDANRMAAFPPREWDAFVAHWRTKVLADDSNRKQTIVVDDVVVGNVVSWTQDGLRLVGYWIGQAHWGRGIATAALREYSKLERVRPLHAFVAAHNAGSIRVLSRCGFRQVERTTSPEGVVELLFCLDD